MDILVCKTCGTVKSTSEFYKSKLTLSGYRGSCKKCINIQNTKYWVENREWLIKHRNSIKFSDIEKYNKEHKEWIMRNRSKYLLSLARKRAKEKNRDFDIEYTDIIIPDVCPYLKISLKTDWASGFDIASPSLDRIDNSKGYTKDNIMVISRLANSMKRDATTEQLITFAKSVLEIHAKAIEDTLNVS
jgi:hypothetical protein